MDSAYLPFPMRVSDVRIETEDKRLKSFRLAFVNDADRDAFTFRPGQFAKLSLNGFGECPIGLASGPTEGGDLLFTVNKMGLVTTELHRLRPGDELGMRGPLGNGYPLAEMEGKNVVMVAGGCAASTLRSTMFWVTHPDNRRRFGAITFILGARTPGMLLYEEEWRSWRESDDVDCHITVDQGTPAWDGHLGNAPAIVEQLALKPGNSLALVCGPPRMIEAVLPIFTKLGWPTEQVFLSLENRMKCGMGFCGRCNVGSKFVCKDGPVFTKAEFDAMPADY
ncbi:MAG TPA: heterodisulfide reductase subunit F [Rhodospirillales bacterium]|nr:heterodisulfide reductase subunit F [Rhodospirillales bacterium]